MIKEFPGQGSRFTSRSRSNLAVDLLMLWTSETTSILVIWSWQGVKDILGGPAWSYRVTCSRGKIKNWKFCFSILRRHPSRWCQKCKWSPTLSLMNTSTARRSCCQSPRWDRSKWLDLANFSEIFHFTRSIEMAKSIQDRVKARDNNTFQSGVIIIVLWNEALWLGFTSHMTSFKQSACINSEWCNYSTLRSDVSSRVMSFNWGE